MPRTDKEYAMKRLRTIALLLALAALPSLYGVEYGGEKSYLLETPYKVCVIPPQVDEAKALGIEVIGTDTAKRLYDTNARFFDAREARHFEHSRIKGAYPVIFDQSKARWMAVELPESRNEPVVFYCYGESCANSYEAALAVRENGYNRVYWMINGFARWLENGYPVENGR